MRAASSILWLAPGPTWDPWIGGLLTEGRYGYRPLGFMVEGVSVCMGFRVEGL